MVEITKERSKNNNNKLKPINNYGRSNGNSKALCK